MNADGYEVIYDITNEHLNWWPVYLLAALTLLGLISIPFSTQERRRGAIGSVGVFTIFSIVAAGFFAMQTLHLQDIKQALHMGRLQDVEGVVHDYRKAAIGSHAPDSFYVGNHHFYTALGWGAIGYGGEEDISNRCVKAIYSQQNEIVWLAVRLSGCNGE